MKLYKLKLIGNIIYSIANSICLATFDLPLKFITKMLAKFETLFYIYSSLNPRAIYPKYLHIFLFQYEPSTRITELNIRHPQQCAFATLGRFHRMQQYTTTTATPTLAICKRLHTHTQTLTKILDKYF